jgi:hypothetical protein
MSENALYPPSTFGGAALVAHEQKVAPEGMHFGHATFEEPSCLRV